MRHSFSANSAHWYWLRFSGAETRVSLNFCSRHWPPMVRLWRSLNNGMVHLVSKTQLSYSRSRLAPSVG